MNYECVNDTALGRLLEPGLAWLAAQLGTVTGISEAERQILYAAAATAIRETVRLKTNRVLIVELHAARITGQHPARAGREEWTATTAGQEFWTSLADHYPTLSPRLAQLIDNRCAAALSLARRFASDRPLLGALTGTEPGELTGLEFGARDSHRGGQTVAVLRLSAGPVVYKPRSVDVDAVLAGLLARLLVAEPAGTRIRVPGVVCREGYGWAEYVPHRSCADDGELGSFYRNLGHWLAVMRLLGGSGLRAENLIAAGPIPTVVDCETLFTPQPPARTSGYGLAVDRAAALVGGSVLGKHWEQVVSAFKQLTGRLHRLDLAGELDGMLAEFADVPIRVVPRSTESYAELGRMLWHPESLQDEPAARWRAADLLSRQAQNLPGRPADPAVIEAEVEELLVGDVPYFATTPRRGRLVGPRGSRWGTTQDLVAGALRRWRDADFTMERQVIRSALVSAYLNEGWLPDQRRLSPSGVRTGPTRCQIRKLDALGVDGDLRR